MANSTPLPSRQSHQIEHMKPVILIAIVVIPAILGWLWMIREMRKNKDLNKTGTIYAQMDDNPQKKVGSRGDVISNASSSGDFGGGGDGM